MNRLFCFVCCCVAAYAISLYWNPFSTDEAKKTPDVASMLDDQRAADRAADQRAADRRSADRAADQRAADLRAAEEQAANRAADQRQQYAKNIQKDRQKETAYQNDDRGYQQQQPGYQQQGSYQQSGWSGQGQGQGRYQNDVQEGFQRDYRGEGYR